MKTRTITRFILCLLVSLVTQNATAVARSSKAQIEHAFTDWIKGPLWQKARSKNISRATYQYAFKHVKLNWSLPDLRPPGHAPRRKPPVQSEFRAPGGYFKARSLNYNIAEGRKQLVKWQHSLDKIEQRYGVPREVIIAIWGKETAFGRARLPYRAIEVLATQAFMGRRKALFEKELLAALTILQQKHITARTMKSAWAGALGHPQFMPTAFLKYAVDFDGDGSINIWSSVPDALASIANFLNQNGWNPARRWGFEVQLPANISCTLEGPDQRIKTLAWQQQGMRRTDGHPFAHADMSKDSFLFLPAGRFGPRFLVSENFYVLKTYNESDVYALFVGHVADRMKAGSKFKRDWTRLSSFSRAQVEAAQLKLEKIGADVGGADGLIGYKTRISIGNWQSINGHEVTCFPNKAILEKISN
ncbi:MAG: lytic murein transglycosylase [bacterium]|nr:lytic murein transglycosylase [bacterium]